MLRLQKGYISGKNLSNETGISISSISKWIKILRKCGYNIESRHSRGYRLIGETDLPVPWELARLLDTIFVGKAKIVYQRTTHSTQNLAILLAEKNPDSDGIVIIAEQQKERTWQGKPEVAISQRRYMAIGHLKTKNACFHYYAPSICSSACSV